MPAWEASASAAANVPGCHAHKCSKRWRREAEGAGSGGVSPPPAAEDASRLSSLPRLFLPLTPPGSSADTAAREGRHPLTTPTASALQHQPPARGLLPQPPPAGFRAPAPGTRCPRPHSGLASSQQQLIMPSADTYPDAWRHRRPPVPPPADAAVARRSPAPLASAHRHLTSAAFYRSLLPPASGPPRQGPGAPVLTQATPPRRSSSECLPLTPGPDACRHRCLPLPSPADTYFAAFANTRGRPAPSAARRHRLLPQTPAATNRDPPSRGPDPLLPTQSWPPCSSLSSYVLQCVYLQTA
ncbi:uncharacterized protein [Manis javanica]|uniref:uncharacterized protein isoform X2 n=1 Tax=Manis javanica TaxID=9974 RepID=UPI003C6D416D